MTSPAKLAKGKIPFKAKQAQPLALSSLSPRFSVQHFFRFPRFLIHPLREHTSSPPQDPQCEKFWSQWIASKSEKNCFFARIQLHEWISIAESRLPFLPFTPTLFCDSPHDEVWAIDKKMLHPSESAKDRNENYILFIFHHIFPHFPISSHSLGPHRARLLCIYSVGFAKAEIYSQRWGDGGEAPIKRRRRRFGWRCASQFAF